MNSSSWGRGVKRNGDIEYYCEDTWKVKYQEEILCRTHSFYPESQQKWVPAEIYSPLQEKCTGMAANHKQSESQKTQLHHQHNASVSQQWIHLLVTQKNGITCQLTI